MPPRTAFLCRASNLPTRPLYTNPRPNPPRSITTTTTTTTTETLPSPSSTLTLTPKPPHTATASTTIPLLLSPTRRYRSESARTSNLRAPGPGPGPGLLQIRTGLGLPPNPALGGCARWLGSTADGVIADYGDGHVEDKTVDQHNELRHHGKRSLAGHRPDGGLTVAGTTGLDGEHRRHNHQRHHQVHHQQHQHQTGRRFQGGRSKGKMLTTPSRHFKLIIPLFSKSHGVHNAHGREDSEYQHEIESESVAILIHPNQPLSFLEHLIQAELPPIKAEQEELEGGHWRAPRVSFSALQTDRNSIRLRKAIHESNRHALNTDEHNDKNQHDKNSQRDDHERHIRHRNGSHALSHNHGHAHHDHQGRSLNHNNNNNNRYVRWSLSTEVGDFVRDAAHVHEFIVTIEGAPTGLSQVHITVPSFSERTYYLRRKLRKISHRLKHTAELKHDCDVQARRGGQRVATSGLIVLASWWCFVYISTFQTNLGWDTMEPVTYLASLSSLMGGYLWFLYHNREISYKSALDFTINARQRRLYQARGVDLVLWETLLDEGKVLRAEIKRIAAEYDVDWHEMADEEDEQVMQALKEEHTDSGDSSSNSSGNSSGNSSADSDANKQ